MQKNSLTISSITTNYNNANYIGECIEGLVNQTTPLNNIIFVDDKSTDNSWQQLKYTLNRFGFKSTSDEKDKLTGFIGSINFIGVRHTENLGPSAGRNTALKIALPISNVICICDSDDVYYNTKVERSIEVFNNYPNIALVYSDYDIETVDNGKVVSKTREIKEPYSFDRLCQECIVSNNSVMDARIIEKVGSYDEKIRHAEDYDLWLRISCVASIYHIPESLYKYRITGNNLTVKTDQKKMTEQLRYVQMRHMERIRAK